MIKKPWAPLFFLIWTGQALSLFGSSLVSFALIWWLTTESNSATVLAIASMFTILPRIFLAPFTGPLIDRFSRKAIMIIADSFIAIVSVGLMLLFWFDAARIWHIYLVTFLSALGGIFHSPAMTSSTSLMVPEKHLGRVAAMNQTLEGVVTLAAPVLGAILIMLIPMKWVLAIDFLSALPAIIPLFFVKIPFPKKELDRGIASSYWRELKDGLKFILGTKAFLTLTILAMFINFVLVPSSSLLPLVVKKIFGKGALELSWVQMGLGFGFVAAGLFLSIWKGFKKKTNSVFFGLVSLGLTIFVIGFAPSRMFFLLPIATFISGVMLVFINSPLMAIRQAIIPHEMQGRVFSLTNAGSAAMGPVGLMIAGPLGDHLGLRIWYLIAGAMCIAFTLIAFSFGDFRKLEML